MFCKVPQSSQTESLQFPRNTRSPLNTPTLRTLQKGDHAHDLLSRKNCWKFVFPRTQNQYTSEHEHGPTPLKTSWGFGWFFSLSTLRGALFWFQFRCMFLVKFIATSHDQKSTKRQLRKGNRLISGKSTGMSCWNFVTILSKLGCFTYLGDVSNRVAKFRQDIPVGRSKLMRRRTFTTKIVALAVSEKTLTVILDPWDWYTLPTWMVEFSGTCTL